MRFICENTFYFNDFASRKAINPLRIHFANEMIKTVEND